MESVSVLTQKLQATNQRHLLFIYSCSAIILILAGFVILHLFSSAALQGLLESQNIPVATQEWRIVSNGIRAGWNIFPPITEICIRSSSGELLFSSEFCPPVSTHWNIAL